MNRAAILISSFSFAFAVGSVLANAELHTAADKPADTQTQEALSDGQVRKIDKEAGKLTIKHGPLANLGMPAMTMVFRTSDPAMLDQVKVGDAIRFRAEKVDGYLTVTRIEPVR